MARLALELRIKLLCGRFQRPNVDADLMHNCMKELHIGRNDHYLWLSVKTISEANSGAHDEVSLRTDVARFRLT